MKTMTMNDLILRAAGRLVASENQTANIPHSETGRGSADGGAGVNSRPRISITAQTNKAIRDAWLRRKGRI